PRNNILGPIVATKAFNAATCRDSDLRHNCQRTGFLAWPTFLIVCHREEKRRAETDIDAALDLRSRNRIFGGDGTRGTANDRPAFSSNASRLFVSQHQQCSPNHVSCLKSRCNNVMSNSLMVFRFHLQALGSLTWRKNVA